MKTITIHPRDNVAVALEDIKAGEMIPASHDGLGEEDLVEAAQDIPRGHKIALTDIKKGEEIIKYVYGNRQSVTQAEFFSAGQQGIDAKYRFTIYASEYGGQTLIEYGGIRYNVYRTYQTKEDLIELYVSEAKTEAVPEVSA